MLGEPDVFPLYGDNTLAWGAAFANEEEWVAVSFNESVYPTRVDIFQTFYSSTIWRVSALDEETNRFVVLWQTDKSSVRSQETSSIFSPPLCPAIFKTRTIMFELLGAGLGAYTEIDAISLTGTKELQQLSFVPFHSSRVVYVPAPLYHGRQTISYKVNRCGNYAKFRDLNAPKGTIDITIQSVNQAPEILQEIVFVDASNYTLTSTFSVDKRFKLPIRDVDETPVNATILSLPAVGTLHLGDSLRLAVGSSFDGSSELLYSTKSCRSSASGKYNVTFNVRISDGEVAVEGPITITVDCDGNVRRVSFGVEILIYAICAVCSVIVIAYAALILKWRSTRSIHAISPLFCLLTITGALMANISPIFLTVTLNSCMAWLSFLTLGACIFFGAIAAKTCSWPS